MLAGYCVAEELRAIAAPLNELPIGHAETRLQLILKHAPNFNNILYEQWIASASAIGVH
jgi:hypothetical protein